MARQMHPVCRLCRREGMKLYLKGEKCYTPKCPVDRRSYPPGMHGKKTTFRRKESDYATQLREKQRARRVYFVLERQFQRYFTEAARRKGLTGETLLAILEGRLDNTVYRLGFADSRSQARQLVRHGHFVVNGRKVNIPSYQVKPGDVVTIRDSSRNNAYFKERADILRDKRPPTWLALDVAGMSGRVLTEPTRDQVDIPLNEQLIVEYYSR